VLEDGRRCRHQHLSPHAKRAAMSQVGIRAREWIFPGRVAFPHLTCSGTKTRLNSLTVAGAAPEWPLRWLHRLPVSPIGAIADGLLNDGESLRVIVRRVNVAALSRAEVWRFDLTTL
jgi:hypothetical protein